MYNAFYQIKSSNYYFWGLIITAILITLFELGKFPNPLIGQNELNSPTIQLIRGDEIRSLSINDWVAIIQKDVPRPIIGTICGNIGSESLCIENPKTNRGEYIPFSEIEILYHGEKFRIGHYTLKGMKNGALAGFLWGAGYTALLAQQDVSEMHYAPLGFACGALVFIPPGTLIGYLKGLKEDRKATEYLLTEPDGWKII